MSKFLRAAAVVATVVLGASAAQAQIVGMAGEYTEGNGVIVQIPQNPPTVPCTFGAAQSARCMANTQNFFGGTAAAPVSSFPHHGVFGAGQGTGGLGVGQAFTVPPLLMQQRLGNQSGIVLNNVVVQLMTAFTAAAGPSTRTINPQGGSRVFSAMNWAGVGAGQNQNNGSTVGGGAARLAANTVVSRTIGLETLNMTYTAGANEFGGTMGVLLDGGGRLFLAGVNIDPQFPASLHPIVGTNPVGDTVPGFNTRNAVGWNYTIAGSQMAGQFKAFPGQASVKAAPCAVTPPPTPAGCNQINGFDTKGFFVAPLPGATSVKHMFAWTTGTVQIVRTAVRRNGALEITDTVTGMGYDTTSVVGTVQNRNVGMVAGSYTTRTDGVPTTQLNYQILGMDLSLTPEPGATIALISGLGLLGALGARRR